MASTAKAPVSTTRAAADETIVAFSPSDLRAPFLLRCAAFSIDYILLLIFPAGWLATGKIFGEGGAESLGSGIWVVATVFFLANFLLFPLFRGQTIGKMLTGLTIVNRDGTRLSAARLLVRNTVGYLITLLTAGLGFILSAFSSSGRTLHDMLAGTIVVHGRKTQI